MVFNDLILSSEHNEMRGDANLRSGGGGEALLKAFSSVVKVQ